MTVISITTCLFDQVDATRQLRKRFVEAPLSESTMFSAYQLCKQDFQDYIHHGYGGADGI